MKKIYEINLEDGWSDIDAALRILEYQFASALVIGERVVKLIHGYGAVGRGLGRLRTEARRWAKNDSRVGFIVKGEEFTVNNPKARYLVEMFPEVANDIDLENGNEGITLLFIK